MVGTSQARIMPLPLQLLLLVALITSLTSASPTPPTASSAHLPVETDDQRDGRVWDMLRQESRSFMSAILPDKLAARTHQVLWSAPLHERAAREDRIPRYTVVAMAGPPMLQSHDTDLLDAALSPRVAGDFGRRANGLGGGRHFPETVGGDDGGRWRPEMTHEAEQMPNALTTDEERRTEDVEAVQAMAGQFGQRSSPRPSYRGSVGDEAAPSAEDYGRAPAGTAPPADIVSGFSSFPQTERVPYLQSVRDIETEMKQESGQTAQPTSSPLVAEFTQPTFEEFPFDSLKMDSSTGGGPEQAMVVELETGNGNENEQLSFDTSNFPNFPTFSFQRAESDQDASERPVAIPAYGHGGSDRLKQDDTGSQRNVEPETTRFPMIPGDQETTNGEDMGSDDKDMPKSVESTESEQQEMLQEMMKKDPETIESPKMEELKSGDMNSTTEDPNVQGIAKDGELTSHAGGLPLAPVTENRNTKTPPTRPANNHFQNFKEGGAYPDFSLVDFPSFPDIPGSPESDLSVQGQAEDAAQHSDVEDNNAEMTTPQKPTVPLTVPPSYGQPPLGQFVYSDIFPEADLSPTEGDEFYARLEFDPTFQTPTAPDFSFSGDTRGSLKFPELRAQFPLIETDFSHARPEFPELRSRFPQPEADFSLSEPELPGLAPLNSEDEDAFQSFAEIADLNRDNNDGVTVFSDDEKMNDRRAINYHSPVQFGSRDPKSYKHFSKSSGNEFKNTFFKSDLTRVTTQRPTTTTARVPKPRRPQHLQRPHGPRHPQGPQRPYPYKPRESAFGRHTTTTTYRPSIFVNRGPNVDGEGAAQEQETSTTPSTSKPSGPAFFPHSGSIPGYIPRPTRPRPHHRLPAREYGQHTAPAEELQPEQEPHPEPESEPSVDSRKIPGYIPRPTPSHRAPEGALGGYIRPTKAALTQQQPTSYELPTAYTPEEHGSSMTEEQAPTYLPVDMSDMSTEDQPPTYMPEEDFSTTVSETAAPIAVTLAEEASPSSSDLTDSSTMPESPSTPLSTSPPAFPPTTQPPATRAATRRPYTFPPFRRSTTPASAIGSGDATTSQFAPEFGTKITHRRPESSSSEDGARRRRPGGRRRPTGGASSGSGSRRRPGMRRRPVGGRRRTTPAPYTTTPAPVEKTTVPQVLEMTGEAVNQQVETEQQVLVIPGDDQREEMTGETVEKQSLLEDISEGSETMPGSVAPMEDVGDFGQQEMLVDVMPREEVSVALVPEEKPAVEMHAEEMIAAEIMPEEMGLAATVTQEVKPVETMQEEMVPVEMMQEGVMVPAEMLPEDVVDAALMPAEIGVPEPNPEGMGPVPIMPVLSEVSQSTAEPMIERAPIVPAPTSDISENTDIYGPPSNEISERETPAMSELPGGIFELQPAVPQSQKGVEGMLMLEGEDAAASPVTASSHLGDVDVRDVTEESDALGTAPGNTVLEEDAVGPTVESELREFAVEENTLGGFGTFPEAEMGDEVDVSAVLRDELGDDVVEEVQVDEVSFPVTSTGPGDNFFTDESLPSLDNMLTPVTPDTAFGPFSGPSALKNNEETIVPSGQPQQEMSRFPMTDGREQGPEMNGIIPPLAVLEAGMPNTENQEFGMPETAPPHMMNGMPVVENNGQNNWVFPSAPSVISDAPETGTSSGMPEMPSDMPPHMSMPGMSMQEFDSNGSQIMREIVPGLVATTPKMEDDMVVPHSMTPEMLEGDQQNILPSDVMPQHDIMPGMPMSEDAMPMPQDATLMPQNIMPLPHDSMDENQDEMRNHSEESSFSSDITMPGDSQTLPAPFPTSIEPAKETTESIPEGFGPLQAYYVITESEEPASDGGMMPDMPNGAANGFQGFPGSEPEEAPVPVEDHFDMAGEDAIAMPDSDDFIPSENFDIRGSFGDDISTGPGEGDSNEATSPDEVFGANPQPDMPLEDATEVDMLPKMMTQPTSDTVFPESGSLGYPVETPIPDTDSIESSITNQGYYPPEAEDQQSLPEEPSTDAVEMGDAPIESQSADIVDEADMNEQTAGIDIRVIAESEPEDAVLTSTMASATESEAEVVDMAPNQYVYPSEERAVSDEADLQDITEEEGREQGEERQENLQEAQEQGQEQGQERQEDLQEAQEEDQGSNERGQDNPAEYQEIREQELIQEEDQEIQEQQQELVPEDQEIQKQELELIQEEDQEIQEQQQELVPEDQEIQEQELELIQEEDQEIQEQQQELVPEDQEIQQQELEMIQEEDQEIQEQQLVQEEDQEQQTPPAGYGPPRSDTIVAEAADDVPADVIVDDVTEEGDVIASATESDILQAYEAVPYEAVSLAYEAEVTEQPAL